MPSTAIGASHSNADVPQPTAQVAQAVIRMIDTPSGGRLIIQLSPEHLGRVEVQIDRTAAGSTHISLTAERPTTLSLLQDNQGQLIAALDDGGATDLARTLSFHAELAEPPDASSPKQGNDPQQPPSPIAATEAPAASQSAMSTASNGHPAGVLDSRPSGTGTSASDRQPHRHQPNHPVPLGPTGALLGSMSDETSSPLPAKALLNWNARLNITA